MSDLSTTEVPRTTQLREIWSKPRLKNILITSIVSPFLPRDMKTSPFKTSGEAHLSSMSGKWMICHTVGLGTGYQLSKTQHIITLFIDPKMQYIGRNKKKEGASHGNMKLNAGGNT